MARVRLALKKKTPLQYKSVVTFLKVMLCFNGFNGFESEDLPVAYCGDHDNYNRDVRVDRFNFDAIEGEVEEDEEEDEEDFEETDGMVDKSEDEEVADNFGDLEDMFKDLAIYMLWMIERVFAKLVSVHHKMDTNFPDIGFAAQFDCLQETLKSLRETRVPYGGCSFFPDPVKGYFTKYTDDRTYDVFKKNVLLIKSIIKHINQYTQMVFALDSEKQEKEWKTRGKLYLENAEGVLGISQKSSCIRARWVCVCSYILSISYMDPQTRKDDHGGMEVLLNKINEDYTIVYD